MVDAADRALRTADSALGTADRALGIADTVFDAAGVEGLLVLHVHHLQRALRPGERHAPHCCWYPLDREKKGERDGYWGRET